MNTTLDDLLSVLDFMLHILVSLIVKYMVTHCIYNLAWILRAALDELWYSYLPLTSLRRLRQTAQDYDTAHKCSTLQSTASISHQAYTCQ